jgi:hypothetical protein
MDGCSLASSSSVRTTSIGSRRGSTTPRRSDGSAVAIGSGGPSLLTPTIGDEFRGKTVTARMMWVGLDEADELVSFVDGETYDRYAAWDGSDWDHPVVSDVVAVSSMGLALVVDPRHRRQASDRQRSGP